MDQPQPSTDRFARVRNALRLLYHGRSPKALRFQLGVLIIDLLIIGFFLITPLIKDRPAFLWIDYFVAVLLAADIVARGLAATDPLRWARQLTTLVDFVILATLLFPALFANFGFLRILRLWTLSRSGQLWRPLKKYNFTQWEEMAQAVVNLTVFLFVVTGFVFTFFARPDSGIEGYIDALYYTVTTVTTTGFGDVTLPGTAGRLTAIVVMIVGITLFVKLAQSIFRPRKVFFPCPQCGLQRHDPDAVHCKACGHLLNIPDDGGR